MIVKQLILNKFFLPLFLTLLFVVCSAQKINVNRAVDAYIDFNSSKNKIFTPTKTYLLMGLSSESENSQNKVLSISYNCFECAGSMKNNDTVVEYKGYKVVIITDNIENKSFLYKSFKNSTASKRFQITPINKNIIYDSPVHLGIRFDDKGKIYFICMGNKTKEIKKILGLNDELEDCDCKPILYPISKDSE